MHAKKEYKEIIAELERQGWRVEMTSSMHYKATPPDPAKTLVHFSTSVDPHAILNNIKKLRQNGFVWPPPSKKELAADRNDGIEHKAGLSSAVLEVMAAAADSHGNDPDFIHAIGVDGPVEIVTGESPEERMDRLFKELKEAKAYCALTVEQEEDCRRAFKKAQEELTLACKESADAGEAFTKKKAEFNAALEAAA